VSDVNPKLRVPRGRIELAEYKSGNRTRNAADPLLDWAEPCWGAFPSGSGAYDDGRL